MTFKNRQINLLILILLFIASQLIFLSPVLAVTREFQWKGTAGYSARVEFDYDKMEDTEVISVMGSGSTQRLNFLIVTFYNPSGEIIERYEDVVNGKSQRKYLEFNFNPLTQQLTGSIDLGGGQSGELFLKGRIDNRLSLVKIEPGGKEYVLDISD